MSQPQIALFIFTLDKTQSIGPAALRELWARACGSTQVSVARSVPSGGFRDRPAYTLYAPQNLENLREVELRLRHLLEEAKLNASLTSLHL